MDAVIGRIADEQCLLTVLLRFCRLQVVMLLEEKSASERSGASLG